MIMVINQEINMQKQEKIYAIRHLSFFYTDEWYESLIDYTDHTGHKLINQTNHAKRYV